MTKDYAGNLMLKYSEYKVKFKVNVHHLKRSMLHIISFQFNTKKGSESYRNINLQEN